MKLTVELKLKPGTGQSMDDAEAEFTRLFTEYLTLPEFPFQEDYGKNAWGGYAGPWVESVEVQRQVP